MVKEASNKEERGNTEQGLCPVTLKDFKPDQEVYALYEENGRNTQDRVSKLTVVSVGRKYVKAVLYGAPYPQYATEFYRSDNGHEYLTENKDWGDKKKLFPSKQAVDGYCQKKALYNKLSKRFYLGIGNFTLAELQAIEDILSEAKDKEDGEWQK